MKTIRNIVAVLFIPALFSCWVFVTKEPPPNLLTAYLGSYAVLMGFICLGLFIKSLEDEI